MLVAVRGYSTGGRVCDSATAELRQREMLVNCGLAFLAAGLVRLREVRANKGRLVPDSLLLTGVRSWDLSREVVTD